MSRKPYGDLEKLDRQIRDAYPVGKRGGNNIHDAFADVVVRKVTAFELFSGDNHNYGMWSDGYEACDGYHWAVAEDLDECIESLVQNASPLPNGRSSLVRRRFGLPGPGLMDIGKPTQPTVSVRCETCKTVEKMDVSPDGCVEINGLRGWTFPPMSCERCSSPLNIETDVPPSS